MTRTRVIFFSLLAALAVFYFVFDPLTTRFMPQCLFHRLTGWECVGCGSQRMLHALLHGDLRGAWEANALALVSLPFIAFLIWLETQRTRRMRLYSRVYSLPMIIAVVVILVGWFILRNLL